jgi:hypothetical protein
MSYEMTPKKLFSDRAYSADIINAPRKTSNKMSYEMTPKKLFSDRAYSADIINAPRKTVNKMSYEMTPKKLFSDKVYSTDVINAPRKTRINNESIDIEPRKLFVPKYNNIRKERNNSLLNAPKKAKRMDESNLELTPKRLFTNKYSSSKNLIRPTKVRDNNQVLLMDNEGNAYIRVNLYDVFMSESK